MPEDSTIDYLSEKGSLRNQFVKHVRNIALPLRRKGLLTTRSTAKCDYDYLVAVGQMHGA
jgi:hypothetical protein